MSDPKAEHGAPPKEPNKPADVAADFDEPGGMFVFVLGMMAFGGACGFIGGISNFRGISQTLMTSVFTFVGGSLLTFVGFRRRVGASERYVLSIRRVGAGVLCFSLSLSGALYGGIELRVAKNLALEDKRAEHPEGSIAAPEANGKNQPKKPGGEPATRVRWGLEAGEESRLLEIKNRLIPGREGYGPPNGAVAASSDVEWLIGKLEACSDAGVP